MSEQSAPICRVFLFGEFRMEWAIPSLDEQAWYHRTSARTVFFLLLCAPHRRATRSQLAGILWPETDEKKALDLVRSALKALRRVLTTTSGETLLHTGALSEIRLAGQERLWVDTDAFEWLVQQASTASTPDEALALWQEANTLLRGEFLVGERSQEWMRAPWVRGRRRLLHAARCQVVRHLTRSYLHLGQQTRAETLLIAHLSQFPTDQDALYHLMKLLISQECLSEALTLYDRCRRALEAVGKEPIPPLQKLTHHLRTLDLTSLVQQHSLPQVSAGSEAGQTLAALLAALSPETLLLLSHAIKQGIVEAASELEEHERDVVH